MQFNLTEDHLKLLQHANIRWDADGYGGVPGFDPKRPYGNSDVLTDVAEIITGVRGLPGETRGDLEDFASFDREGDLKRLDLPDGRTLKYKDLEKLHRETETALQIVLATRSFSPGTYEKDAYGHDWRPYSGLTE